MSKQSTTPNVQSVDASVLPYLGKLSFNTCASRPVVNDLVGVETDLESILNELDDIEAKRPRPWFPDGQFDEKRHRALLLDANKKWKTYYPPKEEKNDDQYDYKNWTNFYPESKGSTINEVENPHWLSPVFQGKRHTTLQEARQAFGQKVSNVVDMSKKDEEEENEAMAKLGEFSEILKSDGDVMQYNGTGENKKKGKEKLSASLVKLLDMLRQPKKGEKKPLWPRKKEGEDDLPPGWISFMKPRKPEQGKMKNWKYGDKHFVGPLWELWFIKNSEGKYNFSKAFTVKDAWLIYLGYQKSVDKGGKKGKKNDGAPRAESDGKGGDVADGGEDGVADGDEDGVADGDEDDENDGDEDDENDDLMALLKS